MNIRKITLVAVALCVAVAAMAAYTLHTFTATTSNDNLIVNFSVSGLGNVSTAKFTLQADADIIITAINNGGNEPPGQIRTISRRGISGTFPAVNGRTTGQLVIAKPSPSEFNNIVPRGMRAISVDVVAYKNISLIGPNGTVLKTISYLASP